MGQIIPRSKRKWIKAKVAIVNLSPRRAIEDQILQEELVDHAYNAVEVRYRLIPGI
jgi:hypothetical protein